MDSLTDGQIDSLAIIFAGIFGLLIGSFLNVVIYRVPKKQSLLKPGSHCPKCNKEIPPYDNIPVFSYIFLLGKCRNCKTKISIRYPLVELLNAVVWMITMWRLGLHIHTFGYLFFFSGLIALSFIDIEKKLLPKSIVYPSGAVLIFFLVLSSIVNGTYNSLRDAAIVALLFSGFLFLVWFLSGGKAMGFGDVRLAIFLGAAMGYYGYIVSYAGLLLSFMFGSVIGIGLIIATRGGRKTKIPFGPFLAMGVIVALWCAPMLSDLVQLNNA